MNYLVIVLTLFVIVGCSKNKPNVKSVHVVNTVDANTNMKVQYTVYSMPNGKEVRHGPFTMWYENGVKYIEGNYSNGKLEGSFTVYTTEEKPFIVGVYHDDKPWDGIFQMGHAVQEYKEGKFLRTLDESLLTAPPK